MDQRTFEEKLDQIFVYMKQILVEKNKSYGGESFYGEGIFPILGNCVRLRDKVSRYTNLVSKFVNDKVEYTSTEANPFGESLWDTICDIFGYACIGLSILSEKGMGKLPENNIEDLEVSYWASAVKSEKTNIQDPYLNKKTGEYTVVSIDDEDADE